MYFSRNGHDYTSVFGPDSNSIGTLTPYIANTFKIDCEKCIIGKTFILSECDLLTTVSSAILRWRNGHLQSQ